MSWARATAIGVAIMAVAIALLAYLPNLVLSGQIEKWHLFTPTLSRSTRVAICVIVMGVALTLILAALRRLQARRVI
jgi:hypothetical protein